MTAISPRDSWRRAAIADRRFRRLGRYHVAMVSPGVSTRSMLDAVTAEFICGDVSISVASRDAANVPAIVRALGTRVNGDRSSIAVFVARSQADEVLRNVGDSGTVAVVWSRPSTNRTVQFKGRDARVEAPAAGDADLVAAHAARFVDEIVALGYPDYLPRTLVASSVDDLAVIAFTPTDGYAQTPGPDAGARLPAPR